MNRPDDGLSQPAQSPLDGGGAGFSSASARERFVGSGGDRPARQGSAESPDLLATPNRPARLELPVSAELPEDSAKPLAETAAQGAETAAQGAETAAQGDQHSEHIHDAAAVGSKADDGDGPEAVDAETDSPRHREPAGSLGQGVLFLMTVTLLFAAARFVVPSIVEEVRYAWHRGELRAEYENAEAGLRNASLDSLSQAYQMVTQHVGPSVVHIEVKRELTDKQIDLAAFLHRDQGMVPLGEESIADQGSGVIVDAEGYILTNEHVIQGGQTIEVGLSDGRRLPATVIGVDPLTDLAVLKVNADRLIPITFGDSESIRVGSPVWAVGSPFGLDRTVTFGILSGKHRMVKASTRYQDFMQSDVAVNPGNSGGPLVDARGRLVGINTAIVGDTYRGVSFSIPSQVARLVYERIRETGKMQRGWLGVALAEVPDDLHQGDSPLVRGALVTGLADERSPAALADIQPGDIIVQADGIELVDVGHLMRVVGNLIVGQEVAFEVLRDGQRRTHRVTIGRRPESITRR